MHKAKRAGLMVLLGTVLGVCSVAAATDPALLKLTASDAAADDYYGYCVAISGEMAIAGAYGDDEGGSRAGSAYLLDVTTGNELAKLGALDAGSDDFFGYSVGISGNTAIVGAHGDDDGGSRSGSGYLFDVTTGEQSAKLTASDAAEDDFFGYSVGISGQVAIVGAYGNDGAGDYSGSAYLFDTSTGEQSAKLTASDAAAGDYFGYSVAISGQVAIVGAYRNDDGGASSGSAYIFDVTTGTQLKLTASDAAARDYFGCSVAIDGNVAIVGAYVDDDAGDYCGSAYLFDVTTGIQLHKLSASDGAAGDWFGISVAISGNIAIVGAVGDDDGGGDAGAMYIFDVSTGDQLAKITAPDADSGDWFGLSVGAWGEHIIVGAYRDEDGGYRSGAVYIRTDTLYTLTVTGGIGGGEYAEGMVVPIVAGAAPSGQEFDAWTGDVGDVADAASASTTVTMPASDVGVTATYTDITYTLTVNSGIGGGEYAEGRVVSIDAGAWPTGQQFDQWIGDTGGIANMDDASTTLTMPAADQEIAATYMDIPLTYWPGDINQDLLVSGPDLDIILAEWGHQGAEIVHPLADISGDGLISGPDLDVILAEWGNTGYQP